MIQSNQTYCVIRKALSNYENSVLDRFRNVRKAYRLLSHTRTTWCSRYSLFNQLLQSAKICVQQSDFINHFKNSIESITYFNNDNFKKPALIHEGKIKFLNPLSNLPWPVFFREHDHKLYFTIGFRKAFYSFNPMPLHHAVLLVTDGKGKHAIFGFNKPIMDGQPCMVNDVNNDVSHHYFFYDELTLCGNVHQARAMFSKIENYYHSTCFGAVNNNCYSMLLSGVLSAAHIGMVVPKDFTERLLIVLSKEQNHGLGLMTNKEIKGEVEKAAQKILGYGK